MKKWWAPRLWYLLLSLLMIMVPIQTKAQQYVPNDLLVTVDPDQLSTVLPLLKATFGDSIQIQSRRFNALNRSVLQVSIRDGQSFDRIVNTLTKWSGKGIKATQKNMVYSLSYVPNDPYLTGPSGSLNVNGNVIYGHNRIIDATTAWDHTQGNGSVIIAVIDTGINSQHQELATQQWTNTQEIPNDYIDNDNNSYIDDVHGYNTHALSNQIDDDYGHGSHVSGLVAGKLNNGIGSAGVCPGCKIMTIKANPSRSGSFTTLSLITGIEYAIANKATIINMSLGGSSPANNLPIEDQLFESSIATAVAAGIPVVVAAGNEHQNIDGFMSYGTLMRQIPASFSTVISVSATKGQTFDTDYSNFGSSIDIAAPGTYLVSASANQSSTDVVIMRGTSMASPVVAGAIGLLYSIAPQMNRLNATELIKKTAIDQGVAGTDIYYGAGLLQIGSAVSALATDTTAPVVTFLSNTQLQKGIPTTVQLRVSDNVTPFCAVSISANYLINGVVSTRQRPPMLTGSPLSITLYPSPNHTAIQLEGIATDVMGLSTVITIPLTVGDLLGPVVTLGPTPTDDQLSGKVVVGISDESGVDFTHLSTEWVIPNSPPIVRSVASHPGLFVIQAPTVSITLDHPNVATLLREASVFRIVARDTLGNTSTHNLTVGSDAAPVIQFVSLPPLGIYPSEPVRATMTDANGLATSSIQVVISSPGYLNTLTPSTHPDAFGITFPTVTIHLPDLTMYPQIDLTLAGSDRMGVRSTASVTIVNEGGLTGPVSGGHHLLIYPNPIQSMDTAPVAAYTLRYPANRGTLSLYDSNRRQVGSVPMSMGQLTQGYHEVSLAGLGVQGIGNGVYLLVASIESAQHKAIIKQRMAIIKNGD